MSSKFGLREKVDISTKGDEQLFDEENLGSKVDFREGHFYFSTKVDFRGDVEIRSAKIISTRKLTHTF